MGFVSTKLLETGQKIFEDFTEIVCKSQMSDKSVIYKY